MKAFVILILLSFITVPAFCISNEDLRAIMDKKVASVGDAIYMVYSLAVPSAAPDDINLIQNARIKSLNRNSDLDAGTFAVIAIELNKAYGGVLYSITGFSRFAAESLVYDGIFPASFTWNRALSGRELIELTAKISSTK
jgi:hypothetical protein